MHLLFLLLLPSMIRNLMAKSLFGESKTTGHDVHHPPTPPTKATSNKRKPKTKMVDDAPAEPMALPPLPLLTPSGPWTARTALPTLTFLPPDHFSRRVVELIFSSAWSPSSPPPPVHMVFRVQHPPQTLTAFENHRNAVRLRARPSDTDPRCAADGNEMMRFCSPDGSPSMPVRTFAGSSDVDLAAGGGKGSGAVLVCRVISGRVRTGRLGTGSPDCDSVRVRDAELVVLDPVAVLPCFLVVYEAHVDHVPK